MYSMTGILKEFLLESMQALIDTKTYGTFRIEKQELVFKENFWKTERERRWTKFLKKIGNPEVTTKLSRNTFKTMLLKR